ncbi:Bbp16 family capsid cement protein [Paraburkholderia unamae]|uniref:Inclusion body protein n=1 Tax=Paraburkholderia unamae TaxID=219649 RepID=A0ABX5KPD8_9BURK|nr:hypothetical protein [Paraburkholderia unamae]PVX84347.1 hypothetical protein C7402_105188 [Paraburkholderia unamae]
MIIDSLLEFSVAQALSATGVSTNVIDLGSDRDIGPGRAMWVVIQLGADAASAGTYQVDLQTDDNSAFSSPTVIGSVSPVAASAKAGARYVMGMPFANERYLRLNYTLGGTTPTLNVNAWLTDQDPTSWQAYPDGIA